MAIKFLSNESIDGTLEVGTLTLGGSSIVAAVGMTLQVDAGSVNAITIDNVGTVTTSGYLKIPNYLFHDGNTDTFLQFGTDTITLRGDSGITLDGPVTANESISITGNVTLDNILLTPATLPAINTPSISLRSTNNEIYFQAGSANVFNFMKADYTTMLALDGTNSATFGGSVLLDGLASNGYRIYKIKLRAPYTGGWGSITPGTVIGGLQQTNFRTDNGQSNIAAAVDFELQDNIYGTGQTCISFKCGGVNGVNSTEKMRINSEGNVGIGNPLAGETYPRELLDIRQSSGTDYPKILVKYDFNDTTSPTTVPTSSLLLSPGQFSSDDTAPRVVGYRTANFASAAARSAGLKFGVAQNNNAKDAVMITEASDIWQLNGANSTGSFAPWDVSYPDSGICINVPAGSSRYLSFADSQTPSYGGGLRYFEASNFTEIYSKLAGAYTTHLRVDRASPYTTWLNPDISGNTGNVGIGISTAPLAKLHLEGTGDMIRVVKNVDSYGPQMDLILNQTSPSNGDTAAYINMGAKDNSGNSKYWGSIRAVVDNIFTEIGGFEFYTRAATDFSKRLKISAQGKVIVYQKDNVSGFYLDGANTRFYANGGGGTDYRGIECNSSGMWSWGETGSSNYFAKNVGIRTTSFASISGAAGTMTFGSTAVALSGGAIFQANGTNVNGIYWESDNMRYQNIGDFSHTFYKNNTAVLFTIATTGTVTAVGDVVAYSDKKLKKNIKTLDGSKVYEMRGVSFDRIDTGKSSSGVIAQEIQEIAPELVNESDGTLGVAYGNLTGYLIEAIKELKTEIEGLKNKPCACNNCNCKE